MVNFYIYYNIYTHTHIHTYIHTHTHIYIYKIAVNPKRYTGIDQYLKYIVPLAKPVQPPVQYWLPCLKPTQMILENAQQRSIIANGARQQWGVRFPWRIKDVWGWHMEAHGWCTSEQNNPLGKGEQVGPVHDPWKDLITHRKAETHTWRGDHWVYTCKWSPTLNNDAKNKWLL